MTTTIHKNLTGADLHEPKGADTALAGYVYVSDGAGSGVWTLASSVITNTAFTTGDVKYTYKTVADTGWIMPLDGGSIGDGSSAATIRANADTASLFALFWNNCVNRDAPVSGGRGASAVADFAAHKRITLPAMLGRVMQISGLGTGLSSRDLGESFGTQTITLAAANIPSLSSSGSNSISVTATNTDIVRRGSATSYTTVASPGSGAYGFNTNSPSDSQPVSTGTNTINVTYTNASPTSVLIWQPSVTVNMMIKL